MADPVAGSNALAQIILAAGTALAAIIGALVLWPTRRRRERAAETAAIEDAEDRPARLRERLTAVETRLGAVDRRLDHVEDELPLLRAREVADETLARLAEAQQPRRPVPRKRTR